MSLITNTREDPLHRVASQVWEQFREARPPGTLMALGNGGGFSGARLWRSEGAGERYCLRAWPANKTVAWVRSLHQRMETARRQGLDFIPRVFATDNGTTVVEKAGRVWELTQWLEGKADFALHPSIKRLEAACEALARLHRAWEQFGTGTESCPAVRQRLQVLADWHTLVARGWKPSTAFSSEPDPVWPVAERVWLALPGWLRQVARWLEPWIDFRCPIQPCLRDVWHDHLLFVGESLTGLVDYGAVRADHPAGDLARMLGSLVGDDGVRWQQGLQAYRRFRPLTDHEERLARMLDRTGAVLALVNWLRWLYHERRSYEDLPAVARRIETLWKRIQQWSIEGL